MKNETKNEKFFIHNKEFNFNNLSEKQLDVLTVFLKERNVSNNYKFESLQSHLLFYVIKYYIDNINIFKKNNIDLTKVDVIKSEDIVKNVKRFSQLRKSFNSQYTKFYTHSDMLKNIFDMNVDNFLELSFNNLVYYNIHKLVEIYTKFQSFYSEKLTSEKEQKLFLKLTNLKLDLFFEKFKFFEFIETQKLISESIFHSNLKNYTDFLSQLNTKIINSNNKNVTIYDLEKIQTYFKNMFEIKSDSKIFDLIVVK